MTQRDFVAIVDSADKMSAELFATRWLLMPEVKDVPGVNPENLNETKQVLLSLHRKLTRTVAEIRVASGLSQRQLADLFAIPFFTVRNWEARGTCAIYIRLMMAELLGQFNPYTDMGLDPRDISGSPFCTNERSKTMKYCDITTVLHKGTIVEIGGQGAPDAGNPNVFVGNIEDVPEELSELIGDLKVAAIDVSGANEYAVRIELCGLHREDLPERLQQLAD